MNTAEPGCPFCLANNLLAVPILAESEGGYVTPAMSHPGNYLIIPREHTTRITDLPDGWMRDFKQLLGHIPDLDHFNVSINIGKSAGQTVNHLHFWIVPRGEEQAAAGKGLVTLLKHVNTE
jgi:diadenosine tetraphosphate (Ap4A) HIT family hydrolase